MVRSKRLCIWCPCQKIVVLAVLKRLWIGRASNIGFWMISNKRFHGVIETHLYSFIGCIHLSLFFILVVRNYVIFKIHPLLTISLRGNNFESLFVVNRICLFAICNTNTPQSTITLYVIFLSFHLQYCICSTCISHWTVKMIWRDAKHNNEWMGGTIIPPRPLNPVFKSNKVKETKLKSHSLLPLPLLHLFLLFIQKSLLLSFKARTLLLFRSLLLLLLFLLLLSISMHTHL